MFRSSIRETPFTTDAADSFFSNITGESFNDRDSTFLATLRALVSPRIPEDESIILLFDGSDFRKNIIERSEDGDVITALVGKLLRNADGGILIHNIHGDEDGNSAAFDCLERGLTGKYPSFRHIQKVGIFFQKSFKVLCFVDDHSKKVALFVENLDVRKLHFLQVAILAFLPWYFDPEKGVTEDEMVLIQSLRETTSTKYEECLAKLYKLYNLEEARIKKLLIGFETRAEKAELERQKRNVENCIEAIRDLNNTISYKLADKADSEVKILGLEAKIANGSEDSELMDYFLCNKSLFLEDVNGNDVKFCTKGYLTYFDPEAAESVINNSNSVIYGYSRRGISKQDMKMLMTEIFVSDSPRLRIRSCATYSFRLNGNVTPIAHRSSFPQGFEDYLPNPHINRYACMGNYERVINDLLLNNDYIGALEQCIASCRSLNWLDGAVMSEFMRGMWGQADYSDKCIELPDGKIVNPIDAIAWLNQQNTEQAEV